MKRYLFFIFLLVLLTGPIYVSALGSIKLNDDWRTASRQSIAIAPRPEVTPEAVVQVYAARAFNWRGIFGVHTWFATKTNGAKNYRVHQVIGWRSWRGLPVVVSKTDIPDRLWYGNRPKILLDVRGEKAGNLIPQIEAAAKSYPYQSDYTVWPGPNSNTFVAWIARQLPELNLELPTTAIGKDYLGGVRLFDRAPSGTGYQLSMFGLLGITVARVEGLEFNALGLNFGIDPFDPAIKLPGVGRIGITGLVFSGSH